MADHTSNFLSYPKCGVSVSIYIYIYMYTCMRACMHAYVYVYLLAYACMADTMHACIYTCVYIYLHICYTTHRMENIRCRNNIRINMYFFFYLSEMANMACIFVYQKMQKQYPNHSSSADNMQYKTR